MTGKIVLPGFIDAHIHLESSLVSPREFAKAVFPLGFDGIRPFSVAGRRVFVYDRGERRITLQEDTPMKIMAIDYGDAHTGIAISDPTGTLAGFSTVINSRKADIVVEEIVRLIAGHGVTELVLGYPKNMDGTLGPRAEKEKI